MIKQHVFERSNLGVAPYAFLGYEKSVYKACADAPVQPGASCDYCGTSIMNVYKLRSSDGKEFKVGCECIKKSGDDGLIRIAAEEERKRKKEREEKRIKAAFAIWDDTSIPLDLNAQQEGYIDFCRTHAGHTGLLKCARMIEKAQKSAAKK